MYCQIKNANNTKTLSIVYIVLTVKKSIQINKKIRKQINKKIKNIVYISISVKLIYNF